MKRTSLCCALAVFCFGCVEDLTPATLVDKSRVLGARVEVAGDPAQARPAPGEDVDVRFFLVDPASPRNRAWALAAFAAQRTPTGDDLPIGEPFAFEMADAAPPGPVVPELRFTVPAVLPPAADSVLLLGVFCVGGGVPVVSLPLENITDVECSDASGQRIFASLAVPIATVAAPNRNANPSLVGVAVTLAEAPWEPPVVALDPGAPCATEASDAAFPRVALSEGEREVEIAARQSDRETFTDDEGVEAREDLLLSHVTTAGEYDAQFSAVDDLNATAGATWEPPDPADVPATGLTIAHHFVVRDGRGGTDWTTRLFCLVP